MKTKHLLLAGFLAALSTLGWAAEPQAAAGKASKADNSQRPMSARTAQAVEDGCRAADTDHDGSISLQEFQADVVRTWQALNPDRSGYVQLSDLAEIPGLNRADLATLKSADRDADGRLSFKEVVSARMAYFDAADTNNDDRLSMQECVSHGLRLLANRPRKAAS